MSLASQKLKFQLVFSLLVVLCALFLTWLILGDSSPLHNYFIWHVTLPNIWAMTVVLPFIFSAVLSGNPHSPPMVIAVIAWVVQWSILGFLLSIPLSRLFVRMRKR